ncbi:MAG: insulinase family protein [Chloroflexi bacterium]|nr:insulinase family protein [Chloroflexota bacterium]
MHKISTLSHGLRMVLSYMPQTTSMTVFIFLNCGSRHETKKENGIAHFIEHMLFRGTAKRPSSQDICGKIEGLE